MSKRRRPTGRLYFRAGRGWYADLRDYADVGGGLEAMKPAGARHATQDQDEALRLLAARLAELDAQRRAGLGAPARDPRLVDYARHHLERKAGYRRRSTVARDAQALERVVGFLGREIRLSQVTVARLSDYVAWRHQQPGCRKGTAVAPQTILHELHALSSLYRRALAEVLVPTNPVARLVDKPRVERREHTWLELDEAARLLRAAGELDAAPAPRAIRFLRPILATFLLTGGRRGEVLGLEVPDVDCTHGVVHIRENAWRRLKRTHHRRAVPLWSQLATILREYLAPSRRTSGLLFPSARGGMLRDLRGSLEAARQRAGIEKRVTFHTFRHTYTAARLQTLDHGAPVSPYTVMRELGHTNLALIEQTYGHLLAVRHRTATVAYRETRILPLRAERSRAR